MKLLSLSSSSYVQSVSKFYQLILQNLAQVWLLLTVLVREAIISHLGNFNSNIIGFPDPTHTPLLCYFPAFIMKIRENNQTLGLLEQVLFKECYSDKCVCEFNLAH